MEKVNKKDYDILQTAYEQLVSQYNAVVNQNKSLQQYPKLFNDHIFKGLTPEKVIEAAKVQLTKTMEETT